MSQNSLALLFVCFRTSMTRRWNNHCLQQLICDFITSMKSPVLKKKGSTSKHVPFWGVKYGGLYRKPLPRWILRNPSRKSSLRWVGMTFGRMLNWWGLWGTYEVAKPWPFPKSGGSFFQPIFEWRAMYPDLRFVSRMIEIMEKKWSSFPVFWATLPVQWAYFPVHVIFNIFEHSQTVKPTK